MSRSIPVMMYHHVSNNPGLVTVTPATFADHMEAISHEGWETLTAARFLAIMNGREEAPPKSLLITFDDGYLDNYVHAFPILQKFGLHAVIFVVTGWIGEGPARPHAGMSNVTLPETPAHRVCMQAVRTGNYDQVMMRWSELESMAGVVDVHSHTHEHRRWDEEIPFPPVRFAAVEKDLFTSKEVLEQRFGQKAPHLCWPWGAWLPAYRESASIMGYAAFYTTTPGVNIAGTGTSSICRFPVKERGAWWVSSRLAIYSSPLLGRIYAYFKGRKR